MNFKEPYQQLDDVIVYIILRVHACHIHPDEVALSAEQIAEYSGELVSSARARNAANRLSFYGVAWRTKPGASTPRFALPARRTISDFELALKASATTLREIFSWPMT